MLNLLMRMVGHCKAESGRRATGLVRPLLPIASPVPPGPETVASRTVTAEDCPLRLDRARVSTRFGAGSGGRLGAQGNFLKIFRRFESL